MSGYRILVALWLLFSLPGLPAAQQSDTERRMVILNAAVAAAFQSGDYARGVDLAKEALKLAEEAFGERHIQTPASLNNLAALYEKLGRYDQAEPLYLRSLELFRRYSGERHPGTLQNLNNLGLLYHTMGRLNEAEAYYEQALELRREVFGERHAATLQSLGSLAGLYKSQGRYGEAETLNIYALDLSREVLGEDHPDTLSQMNNLAFLYWYQGRLQDAEPLMRQCQELRGKVLGPRHPDHLNSLSSLAGLYKDMGRLLEAEQLYLRAVDEKQKILGERHPDTLSAQNGLASLYKKLDRLDEAEKLSDHVVQLRREVLGEHHRSTLSSINDLATLYDRQGRFAEAAPLYGHVIQVATEILGADHPETLLFKLNSSRNLAALGRSGAAAGVLAELEDALLNWLGVEIYATESVTRARNLVASQRAFLDVALSLAITFPDQPQAQNAAASAALHFKGLQAEEEAVIAKLVRQSRDGGTSALATEIQDLRNRLSHAFYGAAKTDALHTLMKELDTKETALARASRLYRDQLKVREARLADLQNTVRQDTVLIEFKRYSPSFFTRFGLGPDRWAAIVLRGGAVWETMDLGPVEDTTDWIATLVAGSAGTDNASRAVYDRLIVPLGITSESSITIAPDNILHLVPFHRLMSADGMFWIETHDVRIVQTGRDLLRAPNSTSGAGLIAMGGIDFDLDADRTDVGERDTVDAGPAAFAELVQRSRAATADAFRDGFSPLPGSGREVAYVSALYSAARPREPVSVWTGTDAAEDRLNNIALPPRVLHLATHGFFRASANAAERPMLLAGVALAGANRALKVDGLDGILSALEVQSLNLEGTELVVLTACETARGVVDYSEGVYGLVRAFRTAGAANILVTLRRIDDATTVAFIRLFYSNWLSQGGTGSDPIKALRDTRLHYIRADPAFDWTPYVIIGNH